jgi:hypothetical protein
VISDSKDDDNPKRRPRVRWEDDVRKDLRKMRVNNWKQRTQERKKWKEIIEQAKTHKRVLELIKKRRRTTTMIMHHCRQILERHFVDDTYIANYKL